MTDSAAEGQRTQLRVLLVEDEPDSADLMTMLLEDADFDVRCVSHAHEALAATPVFRPDVIILDVNLPDMDGIDLATRLRRLDGLSITRMIAVSAISGAAHVQRAASAGIETYLVKPLRMKDLIELIRAEVSTK
ncbi:MAG: response regulator [Deltaproteobacteria bacterium]|nr:response regulator [Deltaproteobacteria bacterium]